MKMNLRIALTSAVMLLLIVVSGCDNDDPKPVNDEEVITTVGITLLSDKGDGEVVTLRFFDADGEVGSAPPEITVSGPLQSMTTYTAVVELLNETEEPAENVTDEVIDEAEDHLFCYTPVGNLTIAYNDDDRDANGLPLGLATTWTTGAAGEASVTVSLRHQQDTKTGECPGGGDTDVEVTFDLVIN